MRTTAWPSCSTVRSPRCPMTCGPPVGVSCYSTYCHALLLGMADPCAMSVRQIELADRWLGQWARKIFPYAQQRETEGPVMLMDLDSSVGAWLAAAAPASPPASMRFGYPGKLATSVRGRLKRAGRRFESGGAAAGPRHVGRRIGGPARAPRPQVVPAAGPRRRRRARGTAADGRWRAGRVFPRGRAHVRPAGSARPPDVPGRAASADVGALTDYDRYKEEAERNWPWERWQGEYAWRDASLIRRDSTRYRWFLDQLIVVRDAERTRVAYVTRVAFSPPAEISLSLAFYAGQPRRSPCAPRRTHSPRSCRCPRCCSGPSTASRRR